MGAARLALARVKGPLPHILKSNFTNAGKDKCNVYTSLNKLIVFVSYCFEQTFINVSNWKLPLNLRFPHLSMFKCRRRAHCEKFGEAVFFILV